MKSIGNHKSPYMVLSVFSAFIFWLYVIDVVDPQQSSTYRNVPVVITGENILENQGLTVIELSHDTVDLDILAPVSTLYALNDSGLSVSLDVSKISTIGEFQTSYTLNMPSNVNSNSLILEQRAPSQITVEVGKLYSETFSINMIMGGSIAEGYQAGSPSVSPETVILNGSVEAVSKVDRIVVMVEQENMSQRFSGELPFVLLDAQGNVIEDDSIEMSETSGFVTLPIVVERTVPLVVNLTPGAGATVENVDNLSITPSSISISGAEEDMIGLEEISLGSIDLSLVMLEKEFTFPIALDTSLMNVSGISEATVKVSVSGLATETFDVTHIQLVNIPEGYLATTSTQVRTVVVRGNRDDLLQIDPSHLRIVADLSNVAAIGSISVPVKVYLDSDGDVGVTGEYNIVVNMAKV